MRPLREMTSLLCDVGSPPHRLLNFDGLDFDSYGTAEAAEAAEERGVVAARTEVEAADVVR